MNTPGRIAGSAYIPSLIESTEKLREISSRIVYLANTERQGSRNAGCRYRELPILMLLLANQRQTFIGKTGDHEHSAKGTLS